MKILVTGSKGFIGKNLITELKNQGYSDIFEYDVDTDKLFLSKYTQECNFVFHLAGVNRPIDEKEFMEGNCGFTSELLDLLRKHNNKAPVLFTSSIQAERNNPYGISKKAGEKLVFSYSKETRTKVFVYRLPNLFGKWSRPNYNTVVATYCHNIARDLDIQINSPDVELTLCYIDDVVYEFIRALKNNSRQPESELIPITKKGLSVAERDDTENVNFYFVPVTYNIKLGELAITIRSFKENRTNLNIPDMENELIKKLYSTYLSFLPEDKFGYALKMNCDHKGSFTEFIRSPAGGQLSVNVSKLGITKGNHWHHTKNEKFIVVSGEGLIRFRKIDEEKIIEYKVSGQKLEIIDIPSGYTHSITNVGEADLITIIWASELFNPEKPDTYYLEV